MTINSYHISCYVISFIFTGIISGLYLASFWLYNDWLDGWNDWMLTGSIIMILFTVLYWLSLIIIWLFDCCITDNGSLSNTQCFLFIYAMFSVVLSFMFIPAKGQNVHKAYDEISISLQIITPIFLIMVIISPCFKNCGNHKQPEIYDI